MRLVVLNGNIGAGKSTILKNMHSHLYNVYEAEVHKWEPFLSLFYADPKRWAFTLQMKIMRYCLDLNEKIVNSRKHLVFTDLNPRTCHCFATANYILGNFSESEYKIFEYVYAFLVNPLFGPHAEILVDVPAEMCLARIERRGRPFERNIPLVYLKTLQLVFKSYDDYTYVMDNSEPDICDVFAQALFTTAIRLESKPDVS